MNAHYPVIIVGGGPVGLALAADLGWRGVSCLVLEQSDGNIPQPKMLTVGSRTMEFCRRWGIAKEVRAAAIPRDFPRVSLYATSLTGKAVFQFTAPEKSGAIEGSKMDNGIEVLTCRRQVHMDGVTMTEWSHEVTVDECIAIGDWWQLRNAMPLECTDWLIRQSDDGNGSATIGLLMLAGF